MTESKNKWAPLTQDTKAPDGITLTGIMPKLTPEQRQYVESLSPEAAQLLEVSLWVEGEKWVLERWVMLAKQMEYVSTLI